MENLEDIARHLQRFNISDYALFILMLLLCVFIGIYFGFVEKRTTDAESNYLMGGRNMMVRII
jgi:sodium-coupled monocarboxylate transporter 8/12